MNGIPAWIGFVIGILAVTRVPMRRWDFSARMLGALIALSLVVTGNALAATAALSMKEERTMKIAVVLFGGVIVGGGIGYFVSWARAGKALRKGRNGPNKSTRAKP